MAFQPLPPDIMAALKEGEYLDGFVDWALTNPHIVRGFFNQADAIAKRRKYYSARSIAEALRHESILRDTVSEWKINNNTVPDLARLYGKARKSELFQFRGR